MSKDKQATVTVNTMTAKQTELFARVQNDFTYHPPKGDQAARYENTRNLMRSLAEHLIQTCPASRELSLALTSLEEVVFWANAAIARNE